MFSINENDTKHLITSHVLGDSLISIVNGLWHGWLGFISQQGQKFLSFSWCLEWLWCPPSLLPLVWN